MFKDGSKEVRHKSGEKCFACSAEKDKGGILVARKMKGKPFVWLGCSRYPDCKNSVPARHTLDNSKEMKKKQNDFEKLEKKWYGKAGFTKQERKEYGETMQFFRNIR